MSSQGGDGLPGYSHGEGSRADPRSRNTAAASVSHLSGKRFPVAYYARWRSQPDDGFGRGRDAHGTAAMGFRPGPGGADVRVRTQRGTLRKPREFLYFGRVTF